MATGLEIKHVRELRLFQKIVWLVVFGLLGASLWFGYKYFESGELPPFVSVKSLTANTNVNESDISSKDIEGYSVNDTHPKFISISTLGDQKSRVFSGSLDKNNQLAFEKNIHDVSWYEKSSNPGDGYGVVILSGHGAGISKNGPFYQLDTLSDGDEITVERGDGKTFTYTVKEVQVLPVKTALSKGVDTLSKPFDELKEGLNIIAPTGKWIPKYRQFDQRIILRAVLEE
jgi:hypothetical protein